MNTRSYPRTAAQAFKGADYACAVERPNPHGRRAARTATVVAVLLLLALMSLGVTR